MRGPSRGPSPLCMAPRQPCSGGIQNWAWLAAASESMAVVATVVPLQQAALPFCCSVAFGGPPCTVRSQSALPTAGCLGERTLPAPEGHARLCRSLPQPLHTLLVGRRGVVDGCLPDERPPTPRRGGRGHLGEDVMVGARPDVRAANILLVAAPAGDRPGRPSPDASPIRSPIPPAP